MVRRIIKTAQYCIPAPETVYLSVKRKNRKTAKAVVYSLLITQAIVQLILFIFFRNEDQSTRIGYIFNSFFFSFIGLCFGILFYVGTEMDYSETGCYFAGQLFSFLILLAVYLDSETPEKKRAKRFKNASDSYLYIYQDTNTLNVYLKPTQLAIAKLESQFDNPNGFLLTRHIASHHDTVISGKTMPIYTVYAFYDVPEKDSLFSKIIVFNDSISIEKFNADVRVDEEVNNSPLPLSTSPATSPK